MGARSPAGIPAEILFLETLAAAKVKTSVIGYTTDAKPRPSHGAFHRNEGLRHYMIKRFDDQLNAATKQTVAGIRDIRMKNNCDCESIRYTWTELMKRTERRKVMFVLTDGMQNFYSDSPEAADNELRRTIAEIERSGVELIAIDFMSGHAKNFYPQTVEVQRSSDLTTAMMDALKKLLKV